MRPKLSAPPPLIAKLTPTVAQQPSDERQRSRYRDSTQHWRAWYKTARWQRLRLRVLLRDQFTCQRPECGRLIGDTSQLVCDHIRPHRGDAALFWDEGNLQSLCKPCHDVVKQAEERRGYSA